MIDRIIQFLYGSLFFLTPLLFTPNTSELFEFNKMNLIYCLTILIVFFWLLKMILAKKIIFKKTSLDIPILIFLSSQIISTIFSIDSHVSLFGYYGRFNGGLLSILCYILLYYGFVSNFINIEKIFKISIFSTLAVIIYALPGKIGHDLTCFFVSGGKIFNNSCWSKESNIFDPADRAFSTLGQPNWLGAYLAINFFIGLFYLIKNFKKNKYLILNTLYLFANFSFILFSRSRSALAAVFIGLVLFYIYYFLTIKNEVKKLIIVLFTVTLIPILLFKTGIDRFDKFISFSISTFKSPNPPVVSKNNLPISASAVTESLDIRKIVWKGAVDLGLKYPFFGTGLETFAYSYYFVRPKSHNLTSEWDYIYNKAHNEFLNYLATSGFIGLAAYILMIAVVLISFILKIKEAGKKIISVYPFLLISYLTILVTNFFGFSTTTINLFFYLIPAILFLENQKKHETFSFKKINNYQYLYIFLLFGTAIFCLYCVYIYWVADTYYAKGLYYLKPQISDYQKGAINFETALKKRKEAIYEDKFSASLAYLAAIAAYKKQSDLAKQLVYLSDYYNQKSLKDSPKNIFYWKTRAKNQYLFYQVTLDPNKLIEGLKSLEVGRKLAPTDPKIPYSISVYYSLLYDIEKDQSQKTVWKNKSLEEINRAIELKENFQDGLILKKELIKKYSQG